MKKLPILLLILCFVYSNTQNVFAQPDKNAVYKDILAKYGKINSLSAVFDSQDGTLTNCTIKAKRGNKYNISLSGKKIISDGNTIWNYNPFAKNVVISDFIPEIAGITLDYFFFNVLENLHPISLKSELSTATGKQYVLELQNKDASQEIRKVNLYLNTNLSKIIAIEIESPSATQMWKITKLEINKTIPDNNFKFKVPKGIEEIDMR